MPKAEIVTLADLRTRYPESDLRHWVWSQSADEPDIGWWTDVEFRPTHKVEVLPARQRGVIPGSFHDYVILEEPVHHNSDRRLAFVPQDRGDDPAFSRFRAQFYARHRDTGKWWHTRNPEPEWVRARCRVRPITYMREIPVELRPREVQGGWVYFIQAQLGGPIKIGWSQNVEQRVAELQTGNPHPLAVLHRIPGTKNNERHLHDLLGHLRVTGEWFADHPEVRRWTDEIRFP